MASQMGRFECFGVIVDSDHHAATKAAKLCHFMAKYNPIEYRKAQRFLTNKLFELLKVDDTTEVTKVISILRNYWVEQQLGSIFPEFLKACDDISEVNL